MIDGFEPLSKTVYQFYGCYWHGCECVKVNRNLKRFKETMEIESLIKKAGYNLISIWEHNAHFEVQTKESFSSVNGRQIALREYIDTAKLKYILEHKDD